MGSRNSPEMDPIELEIFWTRIRSVVDEAAATFVRTAFSTLVRDANDFSVVLTDASGRSLAQSAQSLPSFLCTMPVTIRHFISIFGIDKMREGDVFVTNDPWMGSGHLNDSCLAIPIFRNGRVIAFAGVVTHLPDIGGRLRNPANNDYFEEGLQIPPTRFVDGGIPNDTLLRIIEANNRVPKETLGDLWAQVACCQSLGVSLNSLLDEMIVPFEMFSDDIVRRTENAMREAISAVPDGTYRYVLENDAPPAMKKDVIRIECAVIISGSNVVVDYAGSTEQVDLAINTVANYTYAYTAYAFKCLFAPSIPNAEGTFIPIRVTAPEGSILNPTRPAPCGARAMVGHLLPPSVFGALSSVLPERVQAEPGSPTNSFQLTGTQGNNRYALNGFMGAGQGASANRDGNSAVSFPSNLSNTPIEVLESLVPIEVSERSVRWGSGGAGCHRGGDGIVFQFRMRGATPAKAYFLMNRVRTRAQGLAGGEAGAAGLFSVNGAKVEASGEHIFNKDDVVRIESGGGGGFGSPA